MVGPQPHPLAPAAVRQTRPSRRLLPGDGPRLPGTGRADPRVTSCPVAVAVVRLGRGLGRPESELACAVWFLHGTQSAEQYQVHLWLVDLASRSDPARRGD